MMAAHGDDLDRNWQGPGYFAGAVAVTSSLPSRISASIVCRRTGSRGRPDRLARQILATPTLADIHKSLADESKTSDLDFGCNRPAMPPTWGLPVLGDDNVKASHCGSVRQIPFEHTGA
jgi:hypothetical protein